MIRLHLPRCARSEEKSHCWDVTLVVFLLPVFNWTDFLFIMSDRNNMFRHFNDSMFCI